MSSASGGRDQRCHDSGFPEDLLPKLPGFELAGFSNNRGGDLDDGVLPRSPLTDTCSRRRHASSRNSASCWDFSAGIQEEE